MGFQDATPLLAYPEQLRARADEDGFLFFKQLIPREAIEEVRSRILEVLDRRGLLDRSRPAMDGIVDLEAIHQLTREEVNAYGVGVPLDIYKEVQQLEAFHALAHRPELLRLYETLLGEPAFPHPRNIARVMLPHRELHPTPPHQDFIHIQGAVETWTCWMPLGHAPRSLGGLSMLRGSHKSGRLGIAPASGAGELEAVLCNHDYEWVEGDYEMGDFITFHSLTVHKSLPNRTPGAIRLSADMRFQAASAVIEEHSLKPHGPYEWEELYAGWQRQELMYYWRDQSFQLEPFQDTLKWQTDKIC